MIGHTSEYETMTLLEMRALPLEKIKQFLESIQSRASYDDLTDGEKRLFSVLREAHYGWALAFDE